MLVLNTGMENGKTWSTSLCNSERKQFLFLHTIFELILKFSIPHGFPKSGGGINAGTVLT